MNIKSWSSTFSLFRNLPANTVFKHRDEERVRQEEDGIRQRFAANFRDNGIIGGLDGLLDSLIYYPPTPTRSL